ncbi:WD40 repeat-like protein [Ceratobasidium sp. AG-I]|nr:WD40 repeat-like protein [Ceratobasidium sp. AG-I]
MWDTKTGAAIGKPLVGHSDSVTSVAFSPGGDRIVSGSDDNTVRMWDTKTGAAIGEPLVGHSSWVTSVAFSPGGDHIVSGSRDNTARMWDTTTSENAPSSNHMPLDLSRPSTPALPLLKCPSPNWVLPPHPQLQGWVSLDGSFLLLWLPAHYRRLYDPRALYSISAVPSLSTIYFDFSKFEHGLFWSRIVHNTITHSVA